MIDFDPVEHIYTHNGVAVPSVTQILAPLADFEHVPWDRLQAAADFGRNVHTAVEYLIAGTLDWTDLDDALLPYVKAADKWLALNNPTIIATEQRVYHERLRYAGTVDLVCEIRARTRDHVEVIDWKSSAVMPIQTVGPQTAAYSNSLPIDRARKRRAVLLQPNGEPKDYPLTNANDWSIFTSCLNIHKWKNK